MDKLKIVSINTENLFYFIPPKEDGLYLPNKPKDKMQGLTQSILQLDPDILMLQEIGGLESLQNFNSKFLNNHYQTFLKEGNSDRGIDVGYLVKKNLPFHFKHISHLERPLNFNYRFQKKENRIHKEKNLPPPYPSEKFSRDVSELQFFNNEGDKTPALITLLVHLKSYLDKDGIDFQGRDRREAELKTLVEIYKERDQEFESQVPIILAGDFNGNAKWPGPDREFYSLYEQTDLRDFLSYLEFPFTERSTFVRSLPTGKLNFLQLDYFFISPQIAKNMNKEESGIESYMDGNGKKLKVEDRYDYEVLPADHFPIYLTLNWPLR